MHCAKCGAVLTPDMAYCGNCGTLVEPLPAQANQGGPQAEHVSGAPANSSPVSTPARSYDPTLLASSFSPAFVPQPAPVQPSAPSAPASNPYNPLNPAFNSTTPGGQPMPPAPLANPYSPPSPVPPVALTDPNPATQYAPPPPVGETPFASGGWSEFGGVQTPQAGGMPGGSGTTYPPYSSAPGGYPPAPGYPTYPPGYVPLPQPAPRRRISPAVITILVVGLLLVIFGSVLVGLRIGRTQTVSVATPTVVPVNGTLTAAQLYQKVTGQTPAVVDSLQNPAQSRWSVSEQQNYGCEVKSDGLHVHISDPQHFTYCTSGRGTFTNFAFQVTMKIVSGEGGGLTFRGDTLVGSLYYFHVYPDGSYTFYIEQKHALVTRLGIGDSSAFSTGKGMQNTLTVIAQGSQIYLYVNGQVLTHVQDSTYTSGYLGVLVNETTVPAETVYTNARIWIL